MECICICICISFVFVFVFECVEKEEVRGSGGGTSDRRAVDGMDGTPEAVQHLTHDTMGAALKHTQYNREHQKTQNYTGPIQHDIVQHKLTTPVC